MIGLLDAYDQLADPSSYQAEYEPMAKAIIQTTIMNTPVRTYKVAQGQLPASPDECELWILSGSPASVYGSDPWLNPLAQFIQDIHHKKTKLFGICFGHQMIAHALGGKVEKSRQGWGAGTREFKIKKRETWMNPFQTDIRLIVSHQDQITQLPDCAQIIGTSDFCPFEMYTIEDHILSLQGHPEFTVPFTKGRLDSRIELLTQPIYDTAIDSLNKPTSAELIWSWVENWARHPN